MVSDISKIVIDGKVLKGKLGKDLLHGTKYNDHILGLKGDDKLYGHGGKDLIEGGFGHDLLYGGIGNDHLKGGDGNDKLYGQADNDWLYGGLGQDLLYGGIGHDHLYGGKGNDKLYGQAGNDVIDGGYGDDKLWGHEGNDHLYGGKGNDRLWGGKGNDVIDGGYGDDLIWLGSGKDVVVLAPDKGYDHVRNFKAGEDKIKLTGGLSYFDLKMVPQGTGGKHTLITINKPGTPYHGKRIASLRDVKSSDVTIQDFNFDFLAEVQSLDGSGNNPFDGTLGQSNTIYRRVGEANYADGDGELNTELPNARFISNRIFNDLHINLFSENNLSHLVFGWGQFLDHTFGLAQGGGEEANITFENNDPLEDFQNDLGDILFNRSVGEFVNGQREQNNTVSSFLDAWNVYGGEVPRLDWLRVGSKDGDPTNNSAYLELDRGYLPTRDFLAQKYPDAQIPLPFMDLMSRLQGDPGSAAVAGDIRANENSALTALHTLFAREHNRIVDLLNAAEPNLDPETKFQIARKIVIATQQHITYDEFLPTVGVEADPYQGYDPNVDPRLINEFATVGYRAHSMVHGDFDFPIRNLSDVDLAMLEDQGALRDGNQIEVPVNTQSGNPSVIPKIGLGAVYEGLVETNYNNDEQIDNQLRSILFQLPGFGNGEGEFTDGPPIERLFNVVADIGSIDIQRGRDHGMPSYNDLRKAYGLEEVEFFSQITGETPERVQAIRGFLNDTELKDVDGSEIDGDALIDVAAEVNLNDPEILKFLAVLNRDGELVADPQQIEALLADNMEVEGITAIRKTTLAARLEAIYGDVDDVDAFTGMLAEPHVNGSEFGELQLAIWKDQFERLRDGDRFFHLNDPDLAEIEGRFGIGYQHSLGDIIAFNSDLNRGDLPDNVFISVPEVEAEGEAII